MTHEREQWFKINFTLQNILAVVVMLFGITSYWVNNRNDTDTNKKDVIQLKADIKILNDQVIELRVNDGNRKEQLTRIENAVSRQTVALNEIPYIKIYRKVKQ